MSYFLNWVTITELTSLLFGIIFLIRDKSSFWRILILYIFLSAGTEVLGKYWGRIYHTNLAIYNIFIFIELSFITYGFYNFLKDYVNIKLWILVIYIATLIIYLGYFFIYGINSYNAFTVSIMSVVFVVYGLLYFFVLLKDENYVDLKYHAAFWWVGGVIIYYFGGTIANFFDNIIQQKFLGKYITRMIIYNTLNLILHCFWIYSFICRARQRKICQ
ncbi:hypothetical protein [Pedobacter mendelii]|uniref:YhhN-like protein n=1 Tax=Pedobacter mendelii TaxID=1908240 RepID=A0ABQ2BMJ4_9SPHI|nr:hypothetical protein [Pedobacter mendelii]GGI27697.1 hypothetical protein GCM10008119_28940 [Pedobacter mendelii]